MTYTGKAETPQTIFSLPTPILPSYQSGENIQAAGEMENKRAEFEWFSICWGITDTDKAIKLCRNHKKNIKTKLFLLGAAITAFTFTTFASDALLSPRAVVNQIKIAPGITAAQPALASAGLQTPRAGDNQIKTVAGVVNDSNPALACRNNMNGTPKAVAECTSHTTMPGCMTVAAK